jgi:MinD-like ATPase involved in chromosome partitioning or flagellar assembly
MSGQLTPIAVAVASAQWESALIAALTHPTSSAQVVRRCLDVADLVATSSAGVVRVVVVSSGLPRLDANVVMMLHANQVAVIGCVDGEASPEALRLRAIGVDEVVSVRGSFAALLACIGAQSVSRDENRVGSSVATTSVTSVASGALVAVWGPVGSPGRSSVAIALADEVARAGADSLLIDADVYSSSVAQSLGIIDDAPGIAAACRHADSGTLDVAGLAQLCAQVGHGPRVLTGLPRADRWMELRPSGLVRLWEVARSLSPFVVVDCGFALDHDEDVLFDTLAPRRNAATLTALENADVVVAVGGGEPVGIARLVRGLMDLRDVVPDAEIRVVVTRVRPEPIGAKPERQIRAALARHAGVADVVCIPDDRLAYDRAARDGRTLGEVMPRSPARLALQSFAADVTAQLSTPASSSDPLSA